MLVLKVKDFFQKLSTRTYSNYLEQQLTILCIFSNNDTIFSTVDRFYLFVVEVITSFLNRTDK